ncbi:MAG: hypothetical protein C0519_00800 [Hyphomicrobium sp.]|jgi:hypothetical protein|nr:hypothetical protein [Hyphomicrobium sp.]PPD07975.1 MAG: hypothetical protein CTY28_06755 [Hyphomicrobium sp.]
MIKAFILLPLLFIPAPAEAGHWRDGYKANRAKAERIWQRDSWVRRERPSYRRVGRQGDCPSERDGYCRSVQDWWDIQNNRN